MRYTYSITRDDDILIIKESGELEKAKIIQMIGDLKEQRMSQQKIADSLNARGITTPSGRGKWTIGKVCSLFHSMRKCS